MEEVFFLVVLVSDKRMSCHMNMKVCRVFTNGSYLTTDLTFTLLVRGRVGGFLSGLRTPARRKTSTPPVEPHNRPGVQRNFHLSVRVCNNKTVLIFNKIS